jgi:hypothetical protein
MEIKGTFKKYANARIEDPILSLQDWASIYGRNTFGQKTASTKKIAAESSKYLLSHCTIMSSVMVEEDPYDYLIKPECSHLVNNNDDAWTNEVLKLSHKSFVGAFNFVEHYQNSAHAKGHILDAQLRKINIAPPACWVYFCDILVATDLSHTQLVTDIRNEKVRYLSMGCVTDLVICSYCGTRVIDANTYCNHLAFQKGMFLADEDGVPRRIAELCGHKSMPNGGVKFVEASWVATPAFPGAAKRSVVAEEWVGPKTRFTKAANELAFAKTASQHIDYQDLELDTDTAVLNADLRRRLHNV